MNFIQIKKLTVFMLLSASLFSCSSSAPLTINHYILDTDINAYTAPKPTDQNPEVSAKPPRVVLKQIRLAKYLQQSQLAILQTNQQIYYSQQNIWSESLEHAIARALVNDVNQNNNSYTLLTNNEPHAGKSDYQLTLQLDHFVATDKSEVILAGKYWLTQQGNLVQNAPFYFERTLTEDGFSHAVKQQRSLLKALAKHLQVSLQSMAN